MQKTQIVDSRLMQIYIFFNKFVKKNKYITKIKSNFALWKVEKMSPPLTQGAFEEKLCTWTLFNKSNIQQGVNLYNVSRYDSCARSARVKERSVIHQPARTEL